MDLSCCGSFHIFEVLYQCMCLLSFLKWGSIGCSPGIVQWDFTRRDHPGNPGRVSGSGLVRLVSELLVSKFLGVVHCCATHPVFCIPS